MPLPIQNLYKQPVGAFIAYTDLLNPTSMASISNANHFHSVFEKKTRRVSEHVKQMMCRDKMNRTIYTEFVSASNNFTSGALSGGVFSPSLKTSTPFTNVISSRTVDSMSVSEAGQK